MMAVFFCNPTLTEKDLEDASRWKEVSRVDRLGHACLPGFAGMPFNGGCFPAGLA